MSCAVGCMLFREACADKQRAQELLDTAVKNVELDANEAGRICQHVDSASCTAHKHTDRRAYDILQHVHRFGLLGTDGQVVRNGSTVFTPTEAERVASTLDVALMADEVGEVVASDCPCLDQKPCFSPRCVQVSVAASQAEAGCKKRVATSWEE